MFGEGFDRKGMKKPHINFKGKLYGDEKILDNGIHKRGIIIIMKYNCLKTKTLVPQFLWTI